MILRWLLPIVAALALVGQSVNTYAASGIVGDLACCCPDVTKCKCHDHDGKPVPTPVMKRCHGGAELVAPALLLAIAPAVPIVSETRTIQIVDHVVMPLAEDRPIAIEKPPF